MSRFVCFFFLVMLGLLLAVSLLNLPWPLTLAQHFLPQIFATIIFVTILFVAFRKFYFAIATALLALVSYISMATVPFVKPDGTPKGAASVTVVWANVHRNNEAVTDVLAFAKEQSADLIIFGAFPFRADTTTDNFAPDFPYRFDTGAYPPKAYNASRMIAISQRELLNPTLVPDRIGDNRLFMKFAVNLEADFSINILAAHPFPPETQDYLADQYEFIDRLADSAQEPFLIAGDLNSAPWSSIYRKLPGKHVSDPKWIATWTRWPNSMLPAWLMGIHLDHFLVSPSVIPSDYLIGQDIRSSDHKPIVTTIRLKN